MSDTFPILTGQAGGAALALRRLELAVMKDRLAFDREEVLCKHTRCVVEGDTTFCWQKLDNQLKGVDTLEGKPRTVVLPGNRRFQAAGALAVWEDLQGGPWVEIATLSYVCQLRFGTKESTHRMNMPVMVTLNWKCILGRLVCFYEATSQVVDHGLVREYVKLMFPHTRTEDWSDASNFWNIIHFIERLNKEDGPEDLGYGISLEPTATP